jgi:2-polyprenyl-3-methyl-5-hydroxy-6-metoxy-1,4-benzoquinol methylase
MEVPSTVRHDTAERHLRKYSNQNPMHRLALGRFFDRIAAELITLQPETVLEFGCGEGLFLKEVHERGVDFSEYVGLDLREDALATAGSMFPKGRFERADLFRWPAPEKGFDLVIASQVLEHLPDPQLALERLVELCSGQLLLTVPLEPWFRFLNLIRGRDLRRLGNHPEHVNLWTFSRFRDFVADHAEILRAYRVFPFTVVIARPKNLNARRES